MPDQDGYPTEAELDRIRTWPPSAGWREAFAFIRTCWWAADWGFSEQGDAYSLSTGGWSGNEEIITAMMANKLLWTVCWSSVRRGGHYVFQIPGGE